MPQGAFKITDVLWRDNACADVPIKRIEKIIMTLELENKRYLSVERFLHTSDIELTKTQSYFPCLDAFNKTNVTLNKWTTLKLDSRLTKVTSYEPNNYRGLIVDALGESNKPFHVKKTFGLSELKKSSLINKKKLNE